MSASLSCVCLLCGDRGGLEKITVMREKKNYVCMSELINREAYLNPFHWFQCNPLCSPCCCCCCGSFDWWSCCWSKNFICLTGGLADESLFPLPSKDWRRNWLFKFGNKIRKKPCHILLKKNFKTQTDRQTVGRGFIIIIIFEQWHASCKPVCLDCFHLFLALFFHPIEHEKGLGIAQCNCVAVLTQELDSLKKKIWIEKNMWINSHTERGTMYTYFLQLAMIIRKRVHVGREGFFSGLDPSSPTHCMWLSSPLSNMCVKRGTETLVVW